MKNTQRTGLITLLMLGGYFAYRNRARFQKFLEARGIKTPLDTSGSLLDTIRSGIAKISGRAEHGLNEAESHVRRVS